MACEYICDGCGKRAPAENNRLGYFKPHGWYQRGDKDGIQDACSRECIQKIAKKSGKTDLVAPV